MLEFLQSGPVERTELSGPNKGTGGRGGRRFSTFTGPGSSGAQLARFKSTALYCENMMAEMKALSMLQNDAENRAGEAGTGGVEAPAMTQGRSICALEVLRMLGQSLDPRYAAIIDTIYMELASSVFSGEDFEEYIEGVAEEDSDSSDDDSDDNDDDGGGRHGSGSGSGSGIGNANTSANGNGTGRGGKARKSRRNKRKESTIVITNVSQLDNAFPESSSGGIRGDAEDDGGDSDAEPAEENWHLSDAFDCEFLRPCARGGATRRTGSRQGTQP